jgi:RecA/RadA recombinase
MRKINPHLHGKKAAVVFINQQRESMNPYGPQKFTPGGHGLPYAASLRLELKTTKADRIIKNSETIGHWVTVEVEKSKVCKPYQKARFKLLYE